MTSNNKPTAFLNQVSGDGKTARFTRIAALWPTQNGGFSGTIPEGIQITGRVVIMPADKAEGDSDAPGYFPEATQG